MNSWPGEDSSPKTKIVSAFLSKSNMTPSLKRAKDDE